MHAKGEEIHVAVWPDADDVHHLASRHYAAEEQQALDVAGHYNRPDVFRLTVDERPQRHVDWLRADGRAEPTLAELERAETP